MLYMIIQLKFKKIFKNQRNLMICHFRCLQELLSIFTPLSVIQFRASSPHWFCSVLQFEFHFLQCYSSFPISIVPGTIHHLEASSCSYCKIMNQIVNWHSLSISVLHSSVSQMKKNYPFQTWLYFLCGSSAQISRIWGGGQIVRT